jgi:transposase
MDGAATQFPRLRHVWLDAGYHGKGKGKDWIETPFGWTAQIVQHPPKPRYVWLPKAGEPDWEKITAQLPPPGVHVLPRRWGIERTCSWLGQNRRLRKDYEQHGESEEAWIYIAMTRLMAKRLTAASPFSDSFSTALASRRAILVDRVLFSRVTQRRTQEPSWSFGSRRVTQARQFR